MWLNGSIVSITDTKGEKCHYTIHPDYKGDPIELARETFFKEFRNSKMIASTEIERRSLVKIEERQ